MYRNINFCTFITVFAAEKIKTAGTFPIPILTMLSGLDIALQTTHKSQNTLTVTSAGAAPEPCVGEPQRRHIVSDRGMGTSRQQARYG